MLYANKDKGDHSFFISEDELCKFIGILLLTGHHSVPSEADYWSTQPDLSVPIVRDTTAGNRYQLIKSYMHLADNDLEMGNKVAKVQPMYNKINRNLQQFGILHPMLLIDESMVPYRGLHSCKQYMKSKPIKFGFKLWSLCGHDGYPYHMEIYTGKSEEKFVFGLGGDVVQKMINTVIEIDEGNLKKSAGIFLPLELLELTVLRGHRRKCRAHQNSKRSLKDR